LTHYFIDTNLLLRSVHTTHPMHQDAVGALNTLWDQDHNICLSSQNFIEFWNVCTRPLEKNGLGMSATQTEVELTHLESVFSLLPDTPDIYPTWRHLVTTYGVIGTNVHDARLVAVMLVYNIFQIVTFNIKDFARYSEISATHPTAIIL